MNRHISESCDGISTYRFPRHLYKCDIKDNCLKESFFEINVTFKVNRPNYKIRNTGTGNWGNVH